MADKSLTFSPSAGRPNVSVGTLRWGANLIYLVCVYVPPNKHGRRTSLDALEVTLDALKGQYVIVGGDFNITESSLPVDVGGSGGKGCNPGQGSLLELLNRHCLSDPFLGTPASAHVRNNDHLTHWNYDRSRGRRLDRFYVNFDLPPSLTWEVATIFHPRTDHKGVLLTLRPVAPKGKLTAKRNSVPEAAFTDPHY